MHTLVYSHDNHTHTPTLQPYTCIYTCTYITSITYTYITTIHIHVRVYLHYNHGTHTLYMYLHYNYTHIQMRTHIYTHTHTHSTRTLPIAIIHMCTYCMFQPHTDKYLHYITTIHTVGKTQLCGFCCDCNHNTQVCIRKLISWESLMW